MMEKYTAEREENSWTEANTRKRRSKGKAAFPNPAFSISRIPSICSRSNIPNSPNRNPTTPSRISR